MPLPNGGARKAPARGGAKCGRRTPSNTAASTTTPDIPLSQAPTFGQITRASQSLDGPHQINPRARNPSTLGKDISSTSSASTSSESESSASSEFQASPTPCPTRHKLWIRFKAPDPRLRENQVSYTSSTSAPFVGAASASLEHQPHPAPYLSRPQLGIKFKAPNPRLLNIQASPTPQQINAMAPVTQNPHDVTEAQIKDVIQTLYQTMVQTTTYDQAGRSSKEVLENSTKRLTQNLQTLNATASKYKTHSPPSLPNIPGDIIQYVDAGRNPDIYNREFSELARKSNQLMKGKMDAFSSFRDILASEMAAAMPELKEDVEAVLEATGGKSNDAEPKT